MHACGLTLYTYIAGDTANDYYYVPGHGQGQFIGTQKNKNYDPSESWVAVWDEAKHEGCGIITTQGFSELNIQVSDRYALTAVSEMVHLHTCIAIIPVPSDASCRIVLEGVSKGAFNLSILALDDIGSVVDEWDYVGETVEGATGEISKDIFIHSLKLEIHFEIDYMTGHRPTDSVLEYIHGYFRDNGIYMYFYVDDEISPIDPNVTENEFWQYEAAYDNVFRFDDRAHGDETQGKYDLKEKWILFGTVAAENPTAPGYSTEPITEYGNYIFIADQANDNWASPRPVSTDEVETVALMHEIGHTIGILLLDRPGTDPDGDRTSENYDNASWSVMALLDADNCVADPIRYSRRYWRERDLEYYII